jgi:hypothetical protein
MFRLAAVMFLLTKTTQADYIFKTTFTAQYPESFDTFGSAVTVALNGSTLIAASGVPNIATDPHVEIWKSLNNGQSWTISQSISCCPIPPTLQTTPFNVAFSDSGRTMLIGKPGSTGGTNSDGATLYFDSNGLYLSTTLDLTSQNLPTNGMSVALSGDGTYAFVGAYDGTNGVVSYTYIPGSPPIPKSISITALQPYSLATNTDGSTLVIGTGSKVLVYTAFSYDNSPPTITQTILPTLGETKTFGLSVSLTRDGSVLAIGSCGYGVYIYSSSNFVTPSQILTLPYVTYFGCNVDLSDDGKRLIVGSQNNISLSNGFVYPYQRSGGVFTLENNQLSPPTASYSYGGGGVSVVNQALDYGIVLVGGPSSGAGPSGQIAVFGSVPTSSATSTATASSTSSAIATPSSSSTFSAFSSTSSTRTSTATSTATSSMTATMTSSASATASSSVTSTMTATSTQTLTSTSTSSATASASASSTKSATSSATSTVTSSATASFPSITITITASPSASASINSSNNSLAANSNLLGVTAGIAVSGGILGSLAVYFLINWLRRSPPLTNWFRRNNNTARPLPPTLPTEVTALSKARPNSAATIRKDPPGQLYAYSL